MCHCLFNKESKERSSVDKLDRLIILKMNTMFVFLYSAVFMYIFLKKMTAWIPPIWYCSILYIISYCFYVIYAIKFKMKAFSQYQHCCFPAALVVRWSSWGFRWTTGWLRQKGRKMWRSETPPPKTLSSAISARCRSAGCHWGAQSQAPSPPCLWLWWPRRRIRRVCCMIVLSQCAGAVVGSPKAGVSN